MKLKSLGISRNHLCQHDGMTLVCSDSPLNTVGIVDITDPANPKPAGIVSLGGEPSA